MKVAVVGPSQAGKTMISNFLADATENIGGDISASVFVLCKLFCFFEMGVRGVGIKLSCRGISTNRRSSHS